MESAASLAGTRQHDSVENATDNPALKDSEAYAVTQCLEYADGIAKKYPGGTVLREEYLAVDDEETTAGFPDFVVVSADGETAEVIDWKFGQHGVEDTENNLQGIAYMLGVRRRFPNVIVCTVSFVLPHRDEVDRHTFSLTQHEADKHLLRIRTVVSRAKLAAANPDDFSAASPSVSACLFCALVDRCPKVTEFVLNVSKKYAPMRIPSEVNPTMIQDPTDTSLGIKLAQVAEEWAKGFRARATAKSIEDPDFIPEGYILVPMQRRKVVNAQRLAEIAKALLPADKAVEVDKLYSIPIGEVEELIELVTPRGKKKAAVEAFGVALEEAKAVELGNPYAILKLSTKKSK